MVAVFSADDRVAEGGRARRCPGRRRSRGGVAADGAVGQRGRAGDVVQAAAVPLAELPLTVQLVSVVVPPMTLLRQAAAVRRWRSCR